MNTIIHGDCFDYLRETKERFTTIFADPPDGIGLNYSGFEDVIEEYGFYIRDLLRLSYSRCAFFWLSFNPIRTTDVAWASPVGWPIKHCVQTFTFGQHNHNDLGTNHRPLWRYGSGTLYPDSIRVPSWRQENGDKRADPRGRVPGDVFDIPRVTGNSSQRRAWHPTQLHEDLVERCIKLTTSKSGSVLDLFAGTGTVHRVCKRLGIRSTSIEISEHYYKLLVSEHG